MNTDLNDMIRLLKKAKIKFDLDVDPETSIATLTIENENAICSFTFDNASDIKDVELRSNVYSD